MYFLVSEITMIAIATEMALYNFTKLKDITTYNKIAFVLHMGYVFTTIFMILRGFSAYFYVVVAKFPIIAVIILVSGLKYFFDLKRNNDEGFVL